jgi:hypothetical protein
VIQTSNAEAERKTINTRWNKTNGKSKSKHSRADIGHAM